MMESPTTLAAETVAQVFLLSGNLRRNLATFDARVALMISEVPPWTLHLEPGSYRRSVRRRRLESVSSDQSPLESFALVWQTLERPQPSSTYETFRAGCIN